jgi:UDP-N-acetylmuramoyl-tripeptide--D-alanyl-D-alanine ligase
MLTDTDLRTGLGARLRRTAGAGTATIERAVADSRLCQPGDLFVALPGEHLDGAEYVEDALARGAAAALTSRAPERVPPGRAVYVVDEPLAALHDLAGWWRSRFALPVVAITGTAGKTSTKEITAHLLATRFTVLKTEASLNGDIGLPLMLLRLRPEHTAAVLELGLFYSGEIRLQCRLARPCFGIVTNIGYTHAERLGSIDAIALAKRELVEELPADGLVALNANDPRVLAMAEAARCRVVTYGLAERANVRASAIEDRGLAGLAFTLHADGACARAETPLNGRHNVHNCLAAAAVALANGLALDEIAAALGTASNPLRLKTLPGPNGSIIIDDSYNAGPGSVAAALDVLAAAQPSVPHSARRIAILGDMLELGAEEERLHREIGERAARVADVLVTVGPRGHWIAAAARAAGAADVREWSATEGLAAAVRAELRPGDIALFKASRGMALERVIETVRAGLEPAGSAHDAGERR